jgi:hypothetical protein
MARPAIGLLLFAAAAIGTCLAALPALATDHGSFSLRPGESRQITVGSTYFSLRVCNDIASAGPIAVTVGAHESRTLAPGLCTEQSGDFVGLRNLSGGIAMGVFVSACVVPH